MDKITVEWTDYLKYRLSMRGYDGDTIEQILRHASERYVDTVTRRFVVIGRHGDLLVMIPYEINGNILTPVTIHATTRQQINSRINSGRFSNE